MKTKFLIPVAVATLALGLNACNFIQKDKEQPTEDSVQTQQTDTLDTVEGDSLLIDIAGE
jgi:hypothetical protein